MHYQILLLDYSAITPVLLHHYYICLWYHYILLFVHFFIPFKLLHHYYEMPLLQNRNYYQLLVVVIMYYYHICHYYILLSGATCRWRCRSFLDQCKTRSTRQWLSAHDNQIQVSSWKNYLLDRILPFLMMDNVGWSSGQFELPWR